MRYTKKQFGSHLKEIAVMALMGLIFALFFNDFNIKSIAITIIVWIVLSRGNGWLVELIDKRVSWVDQPIYRLVLGTVVMLLYTILAFGLVVVSTVWWFYGQEPMETIQDFGFSNFFTAILITLIITMFLHGRAFYLEWKEALYREEKLKNETLKTRFESLRNQVNPHFLFNSLNVLSGLVYEDQSKAVDFIRKMSDVYRYVLDKRDQEVVPMEDELRFFNNYAYLQKIRFGDNLNVQVMGESQGMLPPVALQLLLENAIKHNVVSEAKPLTVNVMISEKSITVSNNIQEKLSKDSTGIGLNNLRDRYNYLSDQSIKVEQDEKTFKVTIPILNLEE